MATTPHQVTWMHEFLVVKVTSPYNAIMGRPTLHALGAAMSSYHMTLKFPTKHDVGVVHRNQQIARQCYVAALKGKNKEALSLESLNPREEPVSRGQTAEDLVSVPLDESAPERTVCVGSNLPPERLSKLVSFLRTNADVFAWSTTDMPEIDPSVITHKLIVDPSSKPVQQKKNFATERWKAIGEEIDKLLDVGFIREDNFALMRIDHLVNATTGYELLSFMDVFSGYNQIQMHLDDEEKTSFITEQGTYCYKVISFGLKIARVTYQHLVNKIF
ncbi:PREDICTED: uncharacterized protein LOC104605169 [Nelumbo nucifera]|uniref:Uncharacterized protein LOC104605169 n=1 Tax=Nelumbo nucifera TaxID=4432 RepID=A0A1U8AYE8_NELNU|nr:PREDICTED: uncharacterized protein LOC104605169 [Nelumbo nucifera]